MPRSNHFHGRTIASSAPLPISPRPNFPMSQLATAKLDCITQMAYSNSGLVSNLDFTNTQLVLDSEPNWRVQLNDKNGHVIRITAAWFVSQAEVTFTYEWFDGVNFNVIAQTNPTTYSTPQPHWTGLVPWSGVGVGATSQVGVMITGPYR